MQARTFKIKKTDNTRMARADVQPYGLSPGELPGFDEMVRAYDTASAARKRRACIPAGELQPRVRRRQE